jgi:hypothetical protein
MLQKYFLRALMLGGSVLTACAADLTGNWSMTSHATDGSQHESVLHLQAEGAGFKGKIVSKRGTAEITNGSVSGNQVSFMVIRVGNGDELRIEFRGTLEGDTMKLRMTYRDHDPVLLTAKRAS